MERRNLFYVILTIFVFNVLFQVQLLSQTRNNHIRIELKILKPLKLVRDDTGEEVVSGSVQVELFNQSKRRIELLNLHEHNLLFSSKKGTENYIPFHSCSCVLFKKQQPEFIVLEPGNSKKIIFGNWACDGGTFGVPKPGSYQLGFRILEKTKLNMNSSYAKFSSKRNSNIQEIIKDCRNLLNKENFWKEAIYSNSILVKF